MTCRQPRSPLTSRTSTPPSRSAPHLGAPRVVSALGTFCPHNVTAHALIATRPRSHDAVCVCVADAQSFRQDCDASVTNLRTLAESLKAESAESRSACLLLSPHISAKRGSPLGLWRLALVYLSCPNATTFSLSEVAVSGREFGKRTSVNAARPQCIDPSSDWLALRFPFRHPLPLASSLLLFPLPYSPAQGPGAPRVGPAAVGTSAARPSAVPVQRPRQPSQRSHPAAARCRRGRRGRPEASNCTGPQATSPPPHRPPIRRPSS